MFEQDRVLARLQERVRSDGKIAVCFLTGSYGRRAEEGFSSYISLLNKVLAPFTAALPLDRPARQSLLTARLDGDRSATLTHLQRLLEAFQEARGASIIGQNLRFDGNDAFERALRRLIEARVAKG